MATSKTLQKIAQGLSGAFLGLTGSWLWVICLGGLLTLGVLSTFHVGVLISLGCIGVCLLVAGACLLYGALSRSVPQSNQQRLEDEREGCSLDAEEGVLKTPGTPTASWKVKLPLHRQRQVGKTDQPEPYSRQSTYPSFD
jgi:hypothetical protein